MQLLIITAAGEGTLIHTTFILHFRIEHYGLFWDSSSWYRQSIDQCHDNLVWCLCCNFFASYGRGFSLAIHSTMANQCHSVCMTQLEFPNHSKKCFWYQKCKKLPDGMPMFNHWLRTKVINIIICFLYKLMEGNLQKESAVLLWPPMRHKIRPFITHGTG